MAKETFELVMPLLFDSEGGFSRRPTKEDPGGPTNMGITLDTFRDAMDDPSLQSTHLGAMSKAKAQEIYKEMYWDPIRADKLPAGLDYMVFDFAVNSGPGRAVMELQMILDTKPDGVVGMKTLNAIKRYPGGLSHLMYKYAHERLEFMRALSNWKYNKNGWTKRVETVLEEAKRLAEGTRPQMAALAPTPKATADLTKVSQTLVSKEVVSVISVAVPSVAGLLTGFEPAQYLIAIFVSLFGLLAAYAMFKQIRESFI